MICTTPCLFAQQGEGTLRIELPMGSLEIRSKDENPAQRRISILLDTEPLEEFATERGDRLDYLALYHASDGSYVVLRTRSGAGECAEADIRVLRVYRGRRGGQIPGSDLSPQLQACLGAYPDVSFLPSETGQTVVLVAGNEWSGGAWAPGATVSVAPRQGVSYIAYIPPGAAPGENTAFPACVFAGSYSSLGFVPVPELARQRPNTDRIFRDVLRAFLQARTVIGVSAKGATV